MSHENAKPMVTDVFVKGAIQGWNIATHSTIPNVLMAFVIIRALNVSGALPLIGDLFSPLMALFGLPGEAAAVLVAGWMSMGGGVGVAPLYYLGKQLKAQGKTIVFVSHGMGSVERFCTRAVWLNNGIIQKDGETKEVIQEYLQATQ